MSSYFLRLKTILKILKSWNNNIFGNTISTHNCILISICSLDKFSTRISIYWNFSKSFAIFFLDFYFLKFWNTYLGTKKFTCFFFWITTQIWRKITLLTSRTFSGNWYRMNAFPQKIFFDEDIANLNRFSNSKLLMSAITKIFVKKSECHPAVKLFIISPITTFKL